VTEIASTISFVALYGVSYGVVLFTISVGLVVMLGLMRVVNLAHGAFAAIGGYLALELIGPAGLPWVPAVGLAALAVGGGGLVLERLVYRRLYGASDLDQALLTIGLMFVATASFNLFFGPAVMPARLPAILALPVRIAGQTVQSYRLMVIALGAVLILALWLLFERTRFGARLRAAVDNTTMAQAVGIDVPRLFAIAFAIGCFLAALGGAVGYPMLPIEPTYPFRYLTLVLVVVTLSGFGNISASAIAAIAVGVIDTGGRVLFPDFGAFIIYVVLVGALLWQQHGPGLRWSR
jgi:branched-chain amino acid transport system permease protein